MTLKVVTRGTCPKKWFIGYRMEWRNEVLELIEINGNKYTWIDVEKINRNTRNELCANS